MINRNVSCTAAEKDAPRPNSHQPTSRKGTFHRVTMKADLLQPYISKNFSQIVKHIYCCDINQDLINMAEMNCQHRSNMSFHKITNEPYLNFLKDSSITKAYAYSVLVHCHTTTIINYLKELERVLKPDGLFLFSYCIKSDDDNLIQSDKNKIENTIDKLNFNIIKESKCYWKMFADSVVIELLLSK